MPAIPVDTLLPAITWTLVHSLWQGLILTVLAGLIVLLTRRSSAAFRYAALCAVFFLFLVGVGCTFIVEWKQEMEPFMPNASTEEPGGSNSIFSIEQVKEEATALLNQNAHWIVLVWLVVLLFQTGRIILERIYSQKLRNGKTWSVEPVWRAKINLLAQDLGIRKTVSLVESAVVKVPIVMGHFRPIVMVPIGMLNHLSPGEVEAVLLHELAHIRRYDYLVNYLQRLAETLLFFNPGLLWVSSLLRAEREACCDEIAIAKTGNKRQFAEALIRCKEHALRLPAFSLGLFGSRNQLLHRINRIVSDRNQSLSTSEASFFGISIVALALVLSGWNDRTNVAATVASPSFVAKEQPDKELVAQIVSREPNKKNKQIAISVRPSHSKPGSKRLNASKKKEAREIVAESNTGLHKPAITNEAVQKIDELMNTLPSTPAVRKKEADLRRREIDEKRLQIERDHQQMQIERRKAEAHRKQAEHEREMAMHHRQKAENDRLRADRDRIEIQKLREEFSRHRQRSIVQ